MRTMAMTALIAFTIVTIGLPVAAEAAPTKESLTEQCRKHTETFEYPEAIETCGKAISLRTGFAVGQFG